VKNFFAYAEVWESETKPIAWISGMSVIKKDPKTDDIYIPLHLNLKWLTYKSLRLLKPKLLKNSYVQNSFKSVPITSIDNISII